jgi:DNA-binding MarR family transcriptional regulator
VTARHELGRLRAAGLSPFDIKVLSVFMETGGEFAFYVDRLKPETKDMQIDGMNSLIARDLIEVDTTRSSGHRWMMRLTDNGRAVCAELEKMNARKPVEVQMQGSSPEVIKAP